VGTGSVSTGLVHIVDADPATRRSVAEHLEAAGYRTRAHASGESFLRRVNTKSAACVVLDLDLPGIDGMSILRQLDEQGSALRVIALARHADVKTAVACLKSGAVDFLREPYAPVVLLAAIKAAFALADPRRPGRAHSDAPSRLAALTSRQRQVFFAVATGLTSQAIADKLGLSRRTVEMQRAGMMRKLNADNLADVRRIAFEIGLGRGATD